MHRFHACESDAEGGIGTSRGIISDSADNIYTVVRRILERCNPWPHAANRRMSISQILASWCYLFAVSNSGLLSVQTPRPASHFGHRQPCGLNSSIDTVSFIPQSICCINFACLPCLLPLSFNYQSGSKYLGLYVCKLQHIGDI